MKFIKFNDKVIDTSLFIQLQDMTHLLLDNDEYELQFAFGHSINEEDSILTISHFWDNRTLEESKAGYKTDILLRTIGTRSYTSKKNIIELINEAKEIKMVTFAQSLFTFLEDVRIEEMIKKEKLGTKKWFESRNKILFEYFQTQATANHNRRFLVDAFFSMILVTLLSPIPDPVFNVSDELNELLDEVKPVLQSFFDARSTQDVSDIVINISYKAFEYFKSDMITTYFIYPYHHASLYDTDFDDLTRKDKLANCDTEEMKKDEEETENEKFSTWHREQENGNRNQGFLRFELERGTKTNLMGNGMREGDDSDQALAEIQGSSSDTKRNDYFKLESLEKSKKGNKKQGFPYGEENRFAVSLPYPIQTPSTQDSNLYESLVSELIGEIKWLQKTISLTLEHKRNTHTGPKHFGRLSKNVLPLFYEKNPRVFYKKNEESKDIDAVFTLLVDCSASMNDKMEETKKGIILFHEVLKELHIPHSIVGFWEDSFEAKDEYMPNYYQEIISFEGSVLSKKGAEILQLESRDDNRDGFSIRVAKEKLEARREKHKFLLVFSDGEPSACSYSENGIIDTYNAVNEVKKSGIDVIGFFLSNGLITETEEIYMKNIYGNQHLLIPHIQELPFIFSHLLKRLLLKSI